MDENTETVAVDLEADAADPAPIVSEDPQAADAVEPTVDLWDLLKNELSEEAHQVAQDLAADFPDLLHKLAVAAVDDAPAALKAVLSSPFLQHLEAQLPPVTIGIVHGLLGLVL